MLLDVACVCACACVRACVRACVCVCVCERAVVSEAVSSVHASGCGVCVCCSV